MKEDSNLEDTNIKFSLALNKPTYLEIKKTGEDNCKYNLQCIY